MALFITGTKINRQTTNFGPELADFEVQGAGYSPGGRPLQNIHFGTDGDTAFMTFDTVVWHSATVTARGCLIYNDSLPGRPTIAVINFGREVKSDKGDFSVVIPKATATTAVIRIL